MIFFEFINRNITINKNQPFQTKQQTMKKILLTITICMVAFSFSAFTTLAPKPKLFAGVEKYYASLQAKPDPLHINALNDVGSYITQGMSSDHKITLLFSCPGNSFKSISAQIVLQSLLSLDKTNKLTTASFGYQPANVSPQLLKVLAAHGFIVNNAPAVISGQQAYEIKFGENMPSLVVYAKGANDGVMPKNNFFLMKLCGADENPCADLPGGILYK